MSLRELAELSSLFAQVLRKSLSTTQPVVALFEIVAKSDKPGENCMRCSVPGGHMDQVDFAGLKPGKDNSKLNHQNCLSHLKAHHNKPLESEVFDEVLRKQLSSAQKAEVEKAKAEGYF